MCSRTNAQIFAVRQAYRQLYGKDLEKELIGETSGHFKRLLTSLCAGGRDESNMTDPLKANQVKNIIFSNFTQIFRTLEIFIVLESNVWVPMKALSTPSSRLKTTLNSEWFLTN